MALLSKDHRILEKGPMEFRPFGVNPDGTKIRDVSGISIRSIVDYLEDCIARKEGNGARAVEDLCRLLNERIRDPAYHVTPDFLKNAWNSYSYEFVSFMREFGIVLSGDPQFNFNAGKERNVSPLLQILGRPFTLSQIYNMWPSFGQKYAKDSVIFSVGAVTDRSAVLKLQFTARTHQQFGPYAKRCAELVCQSAKSGLAMVPEKVHGLPPATVKDLKCMAEGDPCCEWEFTWTPHSGRPIARLASGALPALAAFTYCRFFLPTLSLAESLGLSLLPALTVWAATSRFFRKKVARLEGLILEQDRAVDTRHEELREVYLEQAQISVELRQKVLQIEELNVGLEAKIYERTTELEQLNRELRAANDQLQELDRLKSAFVSIVSHELRTPMTSIKGYVENILDGLAGGLTEKQSYYLTRVKMNTERLTRMVNDLLDLSRIEDPEKRHDSLRPVPMSIRDLTAEVVESFQAMARQRSITVRADNPASLPFIQGDRDKLHRVLTNLIGNAIKFTSAGGAVLIETAAGSDGSVQVCITDTGCGIPSHEREKVFDKFFRGAAIPEEAPGAGLGLAITKSLVELHGGRIWLESTPGKGSRFFFSLPLTLPAKQPSR
ncbi:MAG: HAMP domain-containing histidine kinase [Nitrospirae bacterium]|nr:HAMP domain-containing histidine kinase [Nitrospirota bacterium]